MGTRLNVDRLWSLFEAVFFTVAGLSGLVEAVWHAISICSAVISVAFVFFSVVQWLNLKPFWYDMGDTDCR